MKLYTKNRRRRLGLYPKELFAKLEFDKILTLVEERCYSTLGKELVAKIQIHTDPEYIKQLLIQVHEYKQLLMIEEKELPTQNFLDLKAELHYLAVDNSVLNEGQLFKIYRVLQTIFEIVLYFKQEERRENYPEIFALVAKIDVDKRLINAIKDVLDEEGHVRPTASKELMSIRKRINNSYRALERSFNGVIKEYKQLGWLADSVESIRNGRRVLAVASEHKRKIRGIIHDESNSGRITFIEPDATLQVSNGIIELQQAEKREIYRILKTLTASVRPYGQTLQSYQKTLALIDFIRAKARFAWDIEASMPHISNDKTIEIFNARHPLLLLQNKAAKKKTIPLNCNLSLANRILVVSGPNAGGKSVMLKTIGLLQLMLQSGMLVPANDHSIMSIFKQVFVDIGDEQSIENELSTYSSRLKNMQYFLQHANAKTLILIDEFGSGTDPALGGAIAEAILEQLNKKFCYGVITTHYSNLKVYATQTAGIINGCMLFDYRTLSPKYKLDVGKPGSSFAFELAVKSGLSTEVIENAKSKVDSDYKEFDELLATLQQEKQEVINREAKVAAKAAELEALIATYKQKTATLDKDKKKIILATKEKAQAYLTETNQQFENLVREWKENQGEKKVIRKVKNNLHQEKSKVKKEVEQLRDKLYYQKSDKPIQVGSFVKLVNGKDVGQVIELRKDLATVQFDSLKTKVRVKKLTVVEEVKPKEEVSQYSYTNSLYARSAFESNLDVRGFRRQEALDAVESLVDQALVFNVEELKIIHGLGDGILRRSIREMLKKMRAVKNIRDEEPQYGGSGVSLVVLQ